jgi:hypothetical protein
VRNGPIDIIMLTHDRLEHLVATLDALEARTPEPYRLTIVDNASGPELRNWLEENRHRFHQLILRPINEHVPAFTHGIDGTISDPFVVTDPDVIVPELEPSWLARMLDLMDRHPDFGLIGAGLDQVNLPPVLPPERIDPAKVVDDEIVETGVGTILQFIRRDAFVTAYRSDGQACTSVRRAGYRVGWAPDIRALHLGWDDFRLYPGHLLSKSGKAGIYPESYGEIDLIRRPPTLTELALAAPVVKAVRAAGIGDASVLELAWDGPVVGAVLADAVAVDSPAADRVPVADAAAGAVVLKLPPADRAHALVAEACRVAARIVVALAPLDTFGAATPRELAPAGWVGREERAAGDLPLALARSLTGDEGLSGELDASTVEDRERWLAMFAGGAFGKSALRLWIWEREAPRAAPESVVYDAATLPRWEPGSMSRPELRRHGRLARFWRRADLRDRTEVWLGRLRRRNDKEEGT